MQELRRQLNEGRQRAHTLLGECGVSNMVHEEGSLPRVPIISATEHRLLDLIINNTTERNLHVSFFTDPLQEAIGVLKLRNPTIDPPPPAPVLALTSFPATITVLTRLATRFPRVAHELARERQNSQAFAISNEYDVQRLFGALLQLSFDDVRPEEWTPQHAGSASRIDFLLDDEETVIEIKKTRQGLRERELGNQLTLDIAHYAQHPRCKAFVAFIYDPDRLLTNPRGLEKDLRKLSSIMPIHILVAPDV
jgi:hypothetical protein